MNWTKQPGSSNTTPARLDVSEIQEAQARTAGNTAHRDDEEPEPKTNTRHSTDFRMVKWFGKEYSFSVNQAKVVRLLWENWENGTAEVGQETLLNEIDHEYPPDRLRNVFRDRQHGGR